MSRRTEVKTDKKQTKFIYSKGLLTCGGKTEKLHFYL